MSFNGFIERQKDREINEQLNQEDEENGLNEDKETLEQNNK